jgi:membrane-bound ClpP family serine protease
MENIGSKLENPIVKLIFVLLGVLLLVTIIYCLYRKWKLSKDART